MKLQEEASDLSVLDHALVVHSEALELVESGLHEFWVGWATYSERLKEEVECSLDSLLEVGVESLKD